MVILVPWKPLVVIWLLLSGMVFAGHVASRLIEGKPLFAPYRLHQNPARHKSEH